MRPGARGWGTESCQAEFGDDQLRTFGAEVGDLIQTPAPRTARDPRGRRCRYHQRPVVRRWDAATLSHGLEDRLDLSDDVNEETVRTAVSRWMTVFTSEPPKDRKSVAPQSSR